MSQERTFLIGIIGFVLYLFMRKNKNDVYDFILDMPLFPRKWLHDLALFVIDDTTMIIVCVAIPFVLFFRIRV
jgi:hypothetical protein